LIALAEVVLRSRVGRQGGDGGLAAAERALALNPELAEAHAVKGRILVEENRYGEASREIDIALRLNPESYEVNRSAALLRFRQKQIEEAAAYWEKALTLEEGDFGSAGMLITVYKAIGDQEGLQRAAKIALESVKRFWPGIRVTRRHWATQVLRWRRWVSANEQRSGWSARC